MRSDNMTEELPFEARFLNVGSGSAAVINAYTDTVIIDGGLERELLDHELRRLKRPVVNIAAVVVTSTDPDHYRGLRALEPESIHEFWGPKVSESDDEYAEFVNGLRDAGVVVHCVDTESSCDPMTRFTPTTAPEIDLTVLYEGASDSGKRSLVVRLDIGDERLLFTGDIEGKLPKESFEMPPHGAERKVVELAKGELGKTGHVVRPGVRINSNDCPLHADVLVVPDHCSESASTRAFVTLTNPDFAICSGRTGHAASQERVAKRYGKFLRTDFEGTGATHMIRCTRRLDEPILCAYSAAHDNGYSSE